MKKNIAKDLILSACLQKLDELVNNYEGSVTDMNTDASRQDESASQNEDHSAGDDEVLNTLESEREFAQMEMGYLKSLNTDQVNEMVEAGAVVVTNQRIFFIAVSIEKVEIEGEAIYGISTNAPIYSAMAGLKKDDKFEFNGINYKIESIY